MQQLPSDSNPVAEAITTARNLIHQQQFDTAAKALEAVLQGLRGAIARQEGHLKQAEQMRRGAWEGMRSAGTARTSPVASRD